MAAFWIGLASLNLIAGICVAEYLVRTGWFGLSTPTPARAPEAARALPAGGAEHNRANDAVPDESHCDPLPPEMPAAWVETLQANSLKADSIVDAAAQILKFDLISYRQEIVVIDDSLRQEPSSDDNTAIRSVAEELKQFSLNWLSKQQSITDQLMDRRDTLGKFDDLVPRIEESLEEQAAQVETSCSNIEQWIDSIKPAETHQRLLREVQLLADSVHGLRDRLDEVRAITQHTANSSGAPGESGAPREATGIPPRLQKERAFHHWLQADPSATRAASAALFHVDGLSQINQRLGIRAGDHLLDAVGERLAEALASLNHEASSVRLEDNTFFAFFGRLAAREAASKVEEVRQILQSTTFHYKADDLTAMITAAVIVVQNDEDATVAERQLSDALVQAKEKAPGQTNLVQDGRVVAVGAASVA